MRGEFIDVGGARLYYYATGSRGGGEPIVLLHGFPSSSHLWSRVTPALPDGHRVVVVDLLGYGRSDRPRGRPLGVRAHAERVVELLDVLGINFACVVGHELGGGVAQAMAVRWPARVAHLGLVSAVAYDCWPARELRLARAMLPLTRHLPPTFLLSLLRRELLRGYAEGDVGARSVERYLKPFATADGRDALVEHVLSLDAAETQQLAPRLKDLVMPTMVLTGAHDPFLSPAVAERLAGEIPGAVLEVVPDARHFLPEDAPHAVADAITRLLARE
ncbi:MAG: alpha/beta fold hydrolase [Gemmatirosa sp.]